MPGLSVAIMQQGKIKLAEGIGWRNVKDRRPATQKTVYRLASVSKPVSAALLMRLVDQGKIRPCLVGGKRRYSRRELDRFIDEETERYGPLPESS